MGPAEQDNRDGNSEKERVQTASRDNVAIQLCETSTMNSKPLPGGQPVQCCLPSLPFNQSSVLLVLFF